MAAAADTTAGNAEYLLKAGCSLLEEGAREKVTEIGFSITDCRV